MIDNLSPTRTHKFNHLFFIEASILAAGFKDS